MARGVHVGIALLLTVFASVCGAQTNLPGKLAPAPILVRFDGNYQYLSRLYYSGAERPRQPRSVVVLKFMGLNCPPCQRNMPVFRSTMNATMAHAEKTDQKIRFFLVSIDSLSDKEKLRAYLIKNKFDPETDALLDPYQRSAKQFGVTGIPRTFVISPVGEVVADIAGAPKNYSELLREGLAHTLGVRNEPAGNQEEEP